MSDLRDQRGDEEYLRDVLQPMSPLWLLNWITAMLTKRAPHTQGRIVSTIDLSSTQGNPSPEQLAAMNAQADARRHMLDASPAFRAALARIETAGVTHEWAATGEYSYTSRVLYLFIPLDAIPRLQDMAADDAGFDTPEERQKAAERYQRWLLQNYHPDWKAYQQRWPLIELNPYNTDRNEFGSDPNPIRP
jgi:hypothetical protein